MSGTARNEMPALDIKICGLSEPDHVAAALAAGATHIGFIFFARSPRNVSPELAGRLALPARGKAKTVAVTVDETDAFLDTVVEAMAPDMLQLHGSESAARIAEVKKRYGLPVIKAIPVREPSDLAVIAELNGVADRLLLDAKPSPGELLPGGNGRRFDWSVLDLLDDKVDYMLSGGIDIDNVSDAVRNTRASGFDVSSGVESSPGRKQEHLIRNLIERIRQVEWNRDAKSPMEKGPVT